MISNKKYISLALFFLVSLSLHSFEDHDHSSHEQESEVKCQACEENADVKLSISRDIKESQRVPQKTSLIKRFVSYNKTSNLSRAPPFKS